MSHTETKNCRVCASSKPLSSILNLGEQYIANAFHPKDDRPTVTAPLHLGTCVDCGTVQLMHSVQRDLMYKSYWYKSGINQTMKSHLRDLVQEINELVPLKAGDTVIDIGCNDGETLLNYHPNLYRIGVDPSNITPNPKALNAFVNNYFTHSNVNDALGNRKAKVITSIAMFYDLDNPKEFVKDIRSCLADDGVWVLELSYLPLMLKETAYDSICHEHVTYYRLQTFEKTLEGTDLEVIKVDFNDINGGSFRLYVTPKENVGKCDDFDYAVVEYTRAQEHFAFKDERMYIKFCMNVDLQTKKLKEFLANAKKEGKIVYGLGASTKGCVVGQYCNLDSTMITAISERNSDKHGLYTPGVNVRICSEEEMREAKPDYVLVYPWYFFPEIRKRESIMSIAGTKFILPLPRFMVV